MDFTVTWGSCRGIAPVGSLGLPIEERALPTQLALLLAKKERALTPTEWGCK